MTKPLQDKPNQADNRELDNFITELFTSVYPSSRKEARKILSSFIAKEHRLARIDELMHIGGLKVRAKGNYTIDQRLKQLKKEEK